MIFKLHYYLLHTGVCAIGILLGVFLETYTDASTVEIGALFMIMPFLGIITRPMICSMADRAQAYKRYLIACQLILGITYLPFVIIPFLGPEAYEEHPRLCWYILVSLKTIGDLALGGIVSIGDSLAVNYAKRVDTDYTVYRLWGTISWMTFGLIIGQVNEVWFLPKYVPGFMILIASSFIDVFLIWLWPDEYFKMVTISAKPSELDEQIKRSKCLMSRGQVWAHAKRKLLSLVGCSSGSGGSEEPQVSSNFVGSLTPAIKVDDLVKSEGEEQQQQVQQVSPTPTPPPEKREPLPKMTQIRILLLLLKRDPRILLYLGFFLAAGLTCSAPVPFLFISLSEICHREQRCDFSYLAGWLQSSMAGIEIFLFVYMKEIKALLGRLNLACFAACLMMVKYGFYATIWPTVDPYYSILAESVHGVAFGIYLTLMVDVGHVFSQEVECILPELVELGIVDENQDASGIKLSLSATMQALIASAYDGLGRGFGALFYGIIAHHHSYQVLWTVIGGETVVLVGAALMANLGDKVCRFRLGPSASKSGVTIN